MTPDLADFLEKLLLITFMLTISPIIIGTAMGLIWFIIRKYK